MVVGSSQWVPQIQQWARELGFSQIGVAGVDLSSAEDGLMQWLEQGFHGEMHYMAAHGLKRARPAELVPGTVSVITARMDYLPRDTPPPGWQGCRAGAPAPARPRASCRPTPADSPQGGARAAAKLSDRIAQAEIGPPGHRVFYRLAPVLEAEL